MNSDLDHFWFIVSIQESHKRAFLNSNKFQTCLKGGRKKTNIHSATAEAHPTFVQLALPSGWSRHGTEKTEERFQWHCHDHSETENVPWAMLPVPKALTLRDVSGRCGRGVSSVLQIASSNSLETTKEKPLWQSTNDNEKHA